MKKIILVLALLIVSAPVFSEEINLTPKNTFSGFNNNGARPKYPQLNKTLSASDLIEMGSTTPSNDGRAPMTYSQFPQNYDSSNSMMLMQGGMQNMFMGY